jgi:uncharacterized membrane protein YhaH (DUF805 family)
MTTVNPFSFRDRIGRLRFFLILNALGLLDLMNPFPVQGHTIARKTAFSETSAWYFTPVEPVTALSWLGWSLYAAVTVIVLWLFAATVVQRLNDLGVSWKWAAWTFAGFQAAVIIDLAFGGSDPAFSFGDVVSFVLFVPVVCIALFGFCKMLFVPGFTCRHDKLPDSDLRKVLP